MPGREGALCAVAGAIWRLVNTARRSLILRWPRSGPRRMATNSGVCRPPHTVRGLAARLRVTKPVITRALDTMGKLGLVARRRDETDRRSVVIQRTAKGALSVERLGDVLIARARELPR